MTLLQQALEPLRTASKALTEYGATGEIDDLLTAQAGLELVIEQFEQHIAQAEQPVAWLVCSVNKDKSLSLESAAEIAALKAQKDGAYLERNRCVALIAQMAIALGLKAGKARTAIEGWSDDWHGCIYIDLPAGQVSWHYHDSQAFLFDALPAYEGKWDGHDTEEKYRRVGLPFESELRTELEEARKDAERLREAGARLYAAIGDHLPAGPLPVELKDTAQAWIDAAKEQGK